MIPKHIHQIFIAFPDSPIKSIDDHPTFSECYKKTIDFCNNHGYEHSLWTESGIKALLKKYPSYYTDLYNSFPQYIMKCDLARLLILYEYGGLYCDLDLFPVKSLDHFFENRYELFVKWSGHTECYNAIMGCSPKHELFEKILQHCRDSFIAKSQIDVYKNWTGRFVFQTTGHKMIQRVLKKYDYKDLLDIVFVDCKGTKIGDAHTAYFYDFNVSAWYNKKQQTFK
jgi:mannosyltransferase OCH1-like enzyme